MSALLKALRRKFRTPEELCRKLGIDPRLLAEDAAPLKGKVVMAMDEGELSEEELEQIISELEENEAADPEALDALRQHLGLDRRAAQDEPPEFRARPRPGAEPNPGDVRRPRRFGRDNEAGIEKNYRRDAVEQTTQSVADARRRGRSARDVEREFDEAEDRARRREAEDRRHRQAQDSRMAFDMERMGVPSLQERFGRRAS